MAAFAIALYLAAAVLPCEPPLASFRPAAQQNGHGVDAADPAHDHVATSSRERAGASDPHAEHAPRHATGQHANHAPRHAAGHHANHASQAGPIEKTEAHPRRSIQRAKLEIKPTCLCGCSETRSSIGGGTARLGSVVPGTFVARLTEAEPAWAPDFGAAHMIDIHFEIDPVPI